MSFSPESIAYTPAPPSHGHGHQAAFFGTGTGTGGPASAPGSAPALASSAFHGGALAAVDTSLPNTSMQPATPGPAPTPASASTPAAASPGPAVDRSASAAEYLLEGISADRGFQEGLWRSKYGRSSTGGAVRMR